MTIKTKRVLRRKGETGQPHTHSPGEFAARQREEPATGANLGDTTDETDSMKPWDSASSAYSLVDTQSVVNSTETDYTTLMEIADCKDVVAQRLLAQAHIRDDATARDVFEHLVNTKRIDLIRLIGENKYVPTEILDRFVRVARVENDTDLAFAVAKNPGASDYALVELHRHPDVGVRFNVAGNHTTPDDVLENLLDDRDELVRDQAFSAQTERTLMRHYVESMAIKSNYTPVADIAGFIPADSSTPF